VWQLHVIIFKSLAGAVAKLVLYAVYPHTLGSISLPLSISFLFGGIHGSCSILQQVQEGGGVCERTTVYGNCSY